MGFGTLRRLRKWAATCTGFASPGYAAPPGFLGLLTLCSAPRPLRPCFMPVTPLGFGFQSVSPGGSGWTSLDVPFPSCRFQGLARMSRPGRVLPARLQGFAHPSGPFRAGRCYAVPVGRSSLSIHLSEVCFPAASASCVHEASSLGLEHNPGRRRPWLCLLFRVLKEPRSEPLSFDSDLPP